MLQVASPVAEPLPPGDCEELKVLSSAVSVALALALPASLLGEGCAEPDTLPVAKIVAEGVAVPAEDNEALADALLLGEDCELPVTRLLLGVALGQALDEGV